MTEDTPEDENGTEDDTERAIGFTVDLDWKPHAGQQAVRDSDARFKIVSAGRRWGKTKLAATSIIERATAAPDTLCWWVAPSYRVAQTGWNEVTDALPDEFVADRKRSKPRHVDLMNGSRIEFRSTDKPESLVGEGLEHIVIDEAADVGDVAWTESLRPTLADTLGDMLAISTPRPGGWFQEWWRRGDADDDHPAVESWRQTTYANPHVPDSEADAMREQLPERKYRQEVLAEFVGDESSVFGDVRARIVADYNWRSAEGRPPYRIGVDFGRTENYSVVVALDSRGRLVGFARQRDVSWSQIQQRVEALAADHRGRVAVDATRDNKIVADLESAGVRVEPVRFSARKKTELIENLTTAIEQEEITVPSSLDTLIGELESYGYSTTKAGNVTYGPRGTGHDDCVDALALAYSGAGTPRSTGRVPRGRKPRGGKGVPRSIRERGRKER
jgi:phage terminase large subunit